MSSFDACLAVTLEYEGGWSNDAQDPGGATMQGVTQRVYDAYRDLHGQSRRTVREITHTELETIYLRQFYMPVHGSALHTGVDLAVFDYAVNSGVGRAAKALQACVGAKQDGHIGMITLALAGSTPAPELIGRVCNRRMAFLESLGTFGHFGKGWTRRVSEVRRRALEMADTA